MLAVLPLVRCTTPLHRQSAFPLDARFFVDHNLLFADDHARAIALIIGVLLILGLSLFPPLLLVWLQVLCHERV